MRAEAAPASTFLFWAVVGRRLQQHPFNSFRIKPFTIKPFTGRDRSPRVETDGSAPLAAAPSKFPASPHAFPPLRAYNPSTSDKTGMPTAASGKQTVCIRAKPVLRPIAAKKQPLDLLLDVRHGCI